MVSRGATILGGIGMFLLGMILLTDGLKALAGDSLRNYIGCFTGGRFSSVAVPRSPSHSGDDLRDIADRR